MNGEETNKALGTLPVKINDTEYTLKLEINDIQNYIKKSGGFALRARYYDKKDLIDELVKLSDEVQDYKRDFIITALVQGGLNKEEAKKVVGHNIIKVLADLEIWLGMTNPEKKSEFDTLKEKSKNH